MERGNLQSTTSPSPRSPASTLERRPEDVHALVDAPSPIAGMVWTKKDRCLSCGGQFQKVCPNKKFSPPNSNAGTPKSGNAKPRTSSSPTSSTTTKRKKLEVNEEFNHDEADLEMKYLEPQIKNVATQRPDGLLDTGASHPMRQGSNEEYREFRSKLPLQARTRYCDRMNVQGTILVQKENNKVQPIVPLGALIENLGYTLHWSPTKLRLMHPETRMIKVRVNNHCPEAAACDALAMIHELEMKQVNALNSNVETLKARLEVVKLQEIRDWPELLKEYASEGSPRGFKISDYKSN